MCMYMAMARAMYNNYKYMYVYIYIIYIYTYIHTYIHTFNTMCTYHVNMWLSGNGVSKSVGSTYIAIKACYFSTFTYNI